MHRLASRPNIRRDHLVLRYLTNHMVQSKLRGDARTPPPISVVVLGYGPEPVLGACVAALASELRAEDELVLVDNGIRAETMRGLTLTEACRVVGDGHNRGFAGGCAVGVAAASGEVLVFVNSDAIVRPGAVRRLAAAVADHPERGLVSGCLRLAKQPDLVNSVGNPLHFLGLTWAGHCGEPARDHMVAGPVAVATGGLFAISRETWDGLGGFDEAYFAYHEDTDLSLRSWLAKRPVMFEPTAIADHHYEFGRNPQKMYLLERNRFITVLTDYPRPLLVAVGLPLLAIEPLLFAVALREGWAAQKVRAWWWILRHGPELARRRRQVQSQVRARPADIAGLMTSRIEPPMVGPPPGMNLLNDCLGLYWALIVRLLARARVGLSSAPS
jgi:GT2 family glycosyltransferase